MFTPVFDNLDVLYNSTRGCVFFWAMLMIFAEVWIIIMFVKNKLGQSPNQQVYRANKEKKQEPTTYQINNPPYPKDQDYERSQYQPSENKDNQSDIKKQMDSVSAPKSEKDAAPQDHEQKPGLERALLGFEQFLFMYVPFFAINVLNIVCIRNWPFSLVVWFLIMVPITIFNLCGLYLRCQNRFLQCFLRSIWIFVGVAWYLNFYTITSPYRPQA